MARRPAPSAEDLRLLDPGGSFIQRLAADHAALLAALAADDHARVKTIIHGLAGSAGTFGYPTVGDIALRLDEAAAEGKKVSNKAILALLKALEDATKSV